MKYPMRLPGTDVRPQWPKPPSTPRPTFTTQPLTLRMQVLDTPEAIREAQRLAGQLDFTQEAAAHAE